MKLYHISPYSESENLTKMFIPKIPRCTALGEDKTIPRVCFSESVEGCFDAVPTDSRNEISAAGKYFILYEIETKDYPENWFLSNEEIVKKGLVVDANTTKEHWLLKPIKLQGTICKITDIWSEPILDFSVLKATDIIQAARELDAEAFNFFTKEERLSFSTYEPEILYYFLTHRAEQFERYVWSDDLFWILGTTYPDSARKKTAVSYQEVDLKDVLSHKRTMAEKEM